MKIKNTHPVIANSFRFPIVFALGIAFSLYGLQFNISSSVMLFLIVFFSSISIVIFYLNEEASSYYALVLISLSLGFASGVFLDYQIKQQVKIEYFGIEKQNIAIIEAEVVEDAKDTKTGKRLAKILITSVSDSIITGSAYSVQAFLFNDENTVLLVNKKKSKSCDLTSGMKIRFLGKFFEFEDSGSMVICDSKANIELLSWTTTLMKVREIVRFKLLCSIESLPSNSKNFFKALFLGIKDDLENYETELFAKAGCLHILALSGQHLSILASLIMFFLGRFIGKKLSFIVGMVLVCFYVFLVGPQSSILRALYMYLFTGWAFILNRSSIGANSLALAFIVAVFVDPSSAFTLSFVLSYLALIGLIVLAPATLRYLQRYMHRNIAGVLASSIGAQFATGSICLYFFGSLYTGGIIATALTGFLTTFFMWAGMAATLANYFGFTIITKISCFILEVSHFGIQKALFLGSQFPSLILNTIDSGKAAALMLAVIVFLLYGMPYTYLSRRFLHAKTRL